MREAIWLSELGPYALFVIFAIYIILKDTGIIYKNKANGNGNGNGNGYSYAKRLYKMEETVVKLSECCLRLEKMINNVNKKTEELHKWHDIVDADGVRIWYVRKSLEDAIVKLADNIAMQTDILRELATTVKKTATDVQELKAVK